MQKIILAFITSAALFVGAARAEAAQLPEQSPAEKELAAKATDVSEVTLGKTMLAFAAKFMNGKDKDDAATRRLIDGLDGIYIRSYEFDKEGDYSPQQIEQIRKYFETSEWTSMVHDHNKKTGETSDVMVKLVDGQSHGIFILDVEPKEVSIVLILGPIKMEELGELKGISGMSALGNVTQKAKNDAAKQKTGGAQ